MIDVQDDPIDQMEQDHEQMRLLARQWRALGGSPGSAPQRKVLAEQLCTQFTIHARLEEELLDPLSREALGPQALPADTDALRLRARDLIARLLQMRADDPLHDMRVERLCDTIEQHIASQQAGLFPRLRRCGADLALLGRRLRERRRELEAVSEALREEVLVSALA
ncbi:hemerythrin domain-containing protein [Ramlibacter rhizophilus]|uniref:Hemerythrin domain-containing protein n=1 Tax=Ramlibacter rhizophilus TaxID=1781167 RepID=A0A4Z0BC90_9BURK|nr:hemerythrin domain-containing protein [Ramlibacter rhizophilus]TFY96856.1 hemerythrin domain-containing protein [Ramlibacter rhizophilus]